MPAEARFGRLLQNNDSAIHDSAKKDSDHRKLTSPFGGARSLALPRCATCLFLLLLSRAIVAAEDRADVVVYGPTPAGLAAAMPRNLTNHSPRTSRGAGSRWRGRSGPRPRSPKRTGEPRVETSCASLSRTHKADRIRAVARSYSSLDSRYFNRAFTYGPSRTIFASEKSNV